MQYISPNLTNVGFHVLNLINLKVYPHKHDLSSSNQW